MTESAGFSETAAEILRGIGDVTLADLNRAQLLDAAPSATILFTRLRNRIDREVLERAPQVHTVVTTTTGLQHIDVDVLRERQSRLLSLRGETPFLRNVRATAEHTIGLMLSLLRHLQAAPASVKAGAWNRDLFRGGELYEHRIALIGFGRIGQLVHGYLKAFGAEVRFHDPAYPAESVPLEEVLAWAGMVSVHVNWTAANDRFFSRAYFEAMRPGALFINTARGELVDEAALLDMLVSGRLAGAALDVLAGEPQVDSANPLIEYARNNANLVITPHIGGCTNESMMKTEILMATRLREALCGQPAGAN